MERKSCKPLTFESGVDGRDACANGEETCVVWAVWKRRADGLMSIFYKILDVYEEGMCNEQLWIWQQQLLIYMGNSKNRPAFETPSPLTFFLWAHIESI